MGIDLAPGMVALTAAAAEPLGHVQVLEGDAAAPDFLDAEFDVVLAGLVVFFLPDPTAALTEYARVLKPGGRLGLHHVRPRRPAFRAGRQDDRRVRPRCARAASRRTLPRSGVDHRDAHRWAEVTITDQTVETRFTGPTSGGTGRGHTVGMLEQIQAERLDAAREAAVAVMEGAIRG